MNKITLITPPDIYENSNFSIMLMGISDNEQDVVSSWLGKHTDLEHVNVYYYQGENNITWLLYALNRADAVYVNLDSSSEIISLMSSYILSKPTVSFNTQNENLKALMSYINTHHVPNIEEFLKKVFNVNQP